MEFKNTGKISDSINKSINSMNSILSSLSERLKKFEPYVYMLLVIALLLPLWINKHFITQDSPTHLYNARILLDYITGNNMDFHKQYYHSNFTLFPYWFGHLSLAFLLWIFPGVIAEKLIFSIWIILFAYVSRKAITLINKDSVFLSYLVLPFACSYGFQMGFIGFLYSYIFFCITLIFWVKHRHNFSIKHALIIMFLFILTYFTHAVFWAFSTLTVFILFVFSFLSESVCREGFKSAIKKTVKPAFLLLLSVVPSAILFLLYINKNPVVHKGFSYLSTGIVFDNFIKLKTLALVSDAEFSLAAAAGILFALLMIFAIIKKVQNKNITVFDGFYLAAFAALIIDLYSTVNLIGFLERLQFLPFVIFAFWLASCSYPVFVKRLVILISFILTVSFVTARYSTYHKASESVEELLSAQPFIKEKSTILPLNFSNIFIGTEGEEVVKRHPWPCPSSNLFSNSGCYFGVDSTVVVLTNLGALYGMFPFVWRADKCAYYQIQSNTLSGIMGVPPDVDLLAYTPKTKDTIDYVLLINYYDRDSGNYAVRKLFDQLNLEYKEIFKSKTGIARLFKKITFTDIITEAKKSGKLEDIIKLSRYYYENREYQKCIDISENIILNNPVDKEVWAYCGASYMMLDQMGKSVTCLKKAVELNPSNNFAINKLQTAYTVMMADSLYKIAANAAQMLSLSYTYYVNNCFEKGIKACEKALTFEPANADAYNNMCSCYNCLGLWEKAEEACKKAIELRPDFELAKNNLKIAQDGLKK